MFFAFVDDGCWRRVLRTNQRTHSEWWFCTYFSLTRSLRRVMSLIVVRKAVSSGRTSSDILCERGEIKNGAENVVGSYALNMKRRVAG